MKFTPLQKYEILSDLIQNEGGIEEIMKMSLEILMKAEQKEHHRWEQNLSNGYRFRKTYEQGRLLELQIPRTYNGNFIH